MKKGLPSMLVILWGHGIFELTNHFFHIINLENFLPHKINLAKAGNGFGSFSNI